MNVNSTCKSDFRRIVPYFKISTEEDGMIICRTVPGTFNVQKYWIGYWTILVHYLTQILEATKSATQRYTEKADPCRVGQKYWMVYLLCNVNL